MTAIIETKRLILREWQEEDLPAFIKMNSDNEVMEFFPKPLSEPETISFYNRIQERIRENGFGLYAAEMKSERKFIGFVGFNIPRFTSFFTPCVEIGWRIDKKYWGRGLAPEAACECLKYGFSSFGFEKICSFTAFINKKSIRVMEKIGMGRLGEFEHPDIEDGHILKRHVVYQITKK